ncbi:Signal peptidase I [Actinacidiphila bryophytorum]|uniref:Signal peptidase I n=2 Tax=Actinacidiphila bryophytorum TaxID=1436133 RepID=A0A9W4GY86_9ACTN|nr:signal peptidase I [Actinacidiphila bryophytorum]CAG7609483.1 Signal peptidase I [Actinacidiphila bryophytorum]
MAPAKPDPAAGGSPAKDAWEADPAVGSGLPGNGLPGHGVPGPGVPGSGPQGGGLPANGIPAMAGGVPGEPVGPVGPAGPGRDPDDDEDEGRPAHGRKQRSFWKELPLLIGIALVLALLIKTFLVQAFSIPSDSMNNTLLKGDRVLVDKLTPWFGSTPTRGEVVVFHDPGGWLPENPSPSSNVVVRGLQKGLSFIGLMPSADEKDLIKRVIGVGGDTVSCKGTGPVMVNGKALDEPYIFPGNTACSPEVPFTVHVPKGRIWVMGDHRQDSLDSRFHTTLPGGGTVPNSDVVGRAVVVAWPVTRWDVLSIPGTFSQPGINAAAGTAVPAAAGLAGALPLVMWRRRRLLSKAGPVQESAEDC